MERTYTFCLNERDASDTTYPNWTTIRFEGDDCGTMFRLTNRNGNGQSWVDCGSWCYANDTMAVRFTDDTYPVRIVAHVLTGQGAKVSGAKGFGVLFSKATGTNVTGSRVTAAPSLKGKQRDKNVNRSWDANATKFGKLPCHAGTDDETLKRNWNAILAQRAMDASDRKAARAAGIPVASYRALKGK